MLHNGRMGARHLTQIKEESDSREHSSCFLPPITQRTDGGGGGACEPELVSKQKVTCASDPSVFALYEQQRTMEDDRSLLEELGLIEAELRETVRLDDERQREAEFLRQQENKMLWQDLCYLSLSQRLAKPWVSSYFTTFPMHMYCLPVQATPNRRRRRGLNKRK